MEQAREIFAIHKGLLFRVAKPLHNFFDEHHVPDAIRSGHVEMSERRRQIASLAHEMPQSERSSVKR